jgi:peptidoglycan lytic transglycosylase D
VKKNESIATIARKLQVSRADLAEANSLSTKSKLRTGQSLVVPRAPSTLLAANRRPATPTEVASRGITGSAALPTPERQAEPAVERASRSAATTQASSAKTVTYRVKEGDTLFGIAQLFDTTVARIKSLNRLRSNRITPGTRLKIVAAN